MANDKTITLTLKAQAEFNDVISAAQKIQSTLNTLQLPQKLKTGFENTFGDLYKEIEKASAALQNGFKTKGDVTKYEKNINNINILLNKLYSNIQNIDSSKVSVQIDSKKLEEANKKINDLKQQLSNIALDKIQNLQKVFNELGNPNGSKASSWGAFLEQMHQAEPDLAIMQKALNTLNREVAKHTDENGKVAESYIEYAQRIQSMKEVYDILSGKTKEVVDIQNQLNNAISEKEGLSMEAAATGADNLNKAATAASDLREKVGQVGKESVDAAKSAQQLGSEIDQFKNRIAYFFGLSNGVRLFRRALDSAITTVKELDAALTETAVVTNFTVSDMWGKIPEYTKRANELGVTIKDVAEASTLYYQQGLKVNEVNAVTTATLKMARIAGLDAAEATDRMTNALRGFNMEINETSADRIADVYSKLAAISASNVDEISTAMTKTASLANNANMQFETTAAFLAQIIETTRESAETAGTALKTVIARFSEVKELYSQGELLGTDEEGEAIDVNKVSKALRTAGIDLNEYLTGMKGLDDIFMELASKWDSLDRVQQRYIATMAAGSRQQSRFIAMMQDYGRTQELVTAAQNAAGASQEQYQKTLDSLESKLNKLKNSWNEFITAIANQTVIKLAVDSLRTLLDIVNKLTGNSGIAKLAVAFAGFKIGRNFVKNMFAGTRIGEMFLKKGQEAGVGFLGGLEKTIKGAKNFSFEKLFIGDDNYKEQQNSIKELTVLRAQYLQQSSAIGAANAAETASHLLLSDTLSKLGIVEFNEQAIKDAGITQDQMAVLLTNKQIAADFKKLATKKNVTAEEIKEFLAEKVGNEIAEKGLLIRLKENALRLASILGIKTEATAEELNIIAKEKGITVTQALDAVQKKALITMGLYAVAAAALIGIFIAIINNSPEKQLEKASKKAEESAEKANEAAEAYTNLKNSWKELQDKQNTLDTLIKGTEEWKNGLNEVNGQVLSLIENFPKLAKYVSYDENGMLVIDEKGYEQTLQEQQQERIDTARQAFKDRKDQNKLEMSGATNKFETSDVYLLNTLGFDKVYKEAKKRVENGEQVNVSALIKQMYEVDDDLLEHFQEQLKLVQTSFDDYSNNYKVDYGGTDVKLRDAVLSQGVEQGKYKVENKNAINSFLAQYHGSEENIEEYADAFNEIIGTAYEKFLNGTISEEEYKGIDTTNLPSNLGLTESQINDLVGQYEEIFKDLSLKLQQRNINGDWISDQTNATTRQNVFNKFDELAPSQQRVLDESIQKIYQAAGDKGEDFINQLFSESTNWEDIDSLDNLETQLQELGIEVKQTDLTNLINQIIQFKQATSTKATAANLSTQINTQEEIMSTVSDNGTLTDEQKQFAINAGAPEDAFVYTAAGWVYTGNPQDLINNFSQANTDMLQNAVTTYNNASTPENYNNVLQMRQLTGAEGENTSDLNGLEKNPVTEVQIESITKGAKANLQLAESYEAILQGESKVAKAGGEVQRAAIVSANAAEKQRKSYENLNSVIKDNIDALREGDKGTMAKVAKEASKAFDVDIDVDFVDKYKEAFADLAEGVEGSADIITDALVEKVFNEDIFSNWLNQLDNVGITAQDLSTTIQGLDWDAEGQAIWDNTEALMAIAEEVGGLEQLEEAFKRAGIAMDFEWETKEIPVMDPDGRMEYQYIKYPKRAILTNSLGRQQITNAGGGGGGSKSKSKGGGSSPKEEKPKYWDNPYDELYNLIEKQNEALRTREKLEREYDRILQRRSSSAKELLQNSLDEIANLRKEIDIQQQIQAGRRRMINNLGSTGTYRDEEGNEKTYDQWDVTRYAKYNYNTNTIEIDWAGIDQINDPEKGGAVEAYISKLEELVSSFEETEDQIEEMKDLVKEIKERNMQEYLEFEERVYQAIIDREQKVIDEYSALSDTIAESNDRVLNSLQESIDMERQIRDNTKKEEDIADKEARLAYLQRDTSGANQQEILQLQKEIDEASEAYSDQLVDQAIDQMGKDNEKAAQQRQDQIDIMQAQLNYWDENGKFWEETYTLIDDAFEGDGEFKNNSALVNLLKESDAFKGMSTFGQKNWINELATEWKQAYEGQNNWKNQKQNANGTTDTDMSEFAKSSTKTESSSESSSVSPQPSSNTTQTTQQLTDEVKRGVAAAIWHGGLGWSNNPTRKQRLTEVFGSGNGIQALVDRGVGKNASSSEAEKYSYDKMKNIKWKQYAKGGLADFTGPAWLDGTKSAPEMVLSAQDTKNFIALRNALTQMVAQGGNGKGGDNYFDIQINVDELANDYDVDQLASKIKKQIYDDSTYRNVNAINYLR